MRLKQLFFFLLLVISYCNIQAQTSGIKNLYHTDPFFLNPAYAGIDDITQINASASQQWVGLENAPSVQTLSGNGQIAKGLGFGALIYNDRNGLNSDKGLNLSGTYFIELGRSVKPNLSRRLSFGLGFTGFQHSINIENLTDHDYDPLVDNGSKSDIGYKFNIGALLHYDNYIFGISAIGLGESKVDLYNNSLEPKPKILVNAEAGYIFDEISNIRIIPSIVYSNSNLHNYSQLDLNTKGVFIIEEDYNFWLNLSLRGAKDEVNTQLLDLIIQAGIQYSHLSFSYAFDNGLSGFDGSAFYGSHHIMIGIKLKTANKYVLECPAY